MTYKEQLFNYKTIPSLNGWRAVAVTLVVLGHLKTTLKPDNLIYKILDNLIFADFGVRIFFVLSGFLITTLLIKEKNKMGKINIRNFFIRRFLRIVPVLWLYLIVVTILNRLFGFDLTLPYFLGPLLYVTNFYFFPGTWILGHTWSLAVEEQFYLIWPFVFCLIKKPLYFSLVLVILIPFINVLVYIKPNFTYFTLQPFLKPAAAIFTGTIMAILWSKNFHGFNVAHWLKTFFFSMAVGLAFLISLAQHHGKLGIILLPFGDIILNLCIVYMITFSVIKNTSIRVILNTKILTYIGILSYSIYIWQQLFIIPNDMFSNWARYFVFPVNILVIAIVAWLSHYYFEKPFLKFKHKFSIIK